MLAISETQNSQVKSLFHDSVQVCSGTPTKNLLPPLCAFCKITKHCPKQHPFPNVLIITLPKEGLPLSVYRRSLNYQRTELDIFKESYTLQGNNPMETKTTFFR